MGYEAKKTEHAGPKRGTASRLSRLAVGMGTRGRAGEETPFTVSSLKSPRLQRKARSSNKELSCAFPICGSTT